MLMQSPPCGERIPITMLVFECPFGWCSLAFLDGSLGLERCSWCIFRVVHVAVVGLLLVVALVAWLLVHFILCTNCVTGPTKVTRGVG